MKVSIYVNRMVFESINMIRKWKSFQKLFHINESNGNINLPAANHLQKSILEFHKFINLLEIPSNMKRNPQKQCNYSYPDNISWIVGILTFGFACHEREHNSILFKLAACDSFFFLVVTLLLGAFWVRCCAVKLTLSYMNCINHTHRQSPMQIFIMKTNTIWRQQFREFGEIPGSHHKTDVVVCSLMIAPIIIFESFGF